MKVDSLWITEFGKIETKQVEINNEPAFDQVQVEIKACGICAWDVALFNGKNTPGQYPFMHGHEGIGYVRKIGAGIHDIKVGQLVMCTDDGSPQMVQVQNILRSSLSPISAQLEEDDFPYWIGEPVVCVVSSLANIKIKPGSNVVLIGAGYMGLLMVQGLARSLAGSITVIDPHDNKLSLAKKFGADIVCKSGLISTEAKIDDIQNHGGVELVIECSGSSSGLDTANRLLAQSGILNLFAWHRGNRTINMTAWHQRGYSIYNTAPNIDRHFQDHISEAEILMRKAVFYQNDLITHIEPYSKAQNIMEIASNKLDGYIKGVITF